MAEGSNHARRWMLRARRPGRFALIGVLNTGIDVAVFSLLSTFTPLALVWVNTVSYSAGGLNSFLCNKFWTFGDLDQHHAAGRQALMFITFTVAGLLISNVTVVAAALVVPELLAKLLSIPVVVVWNFWTSARFVYRPICGK